jgi:hypothetical protein
VHVPGFAALADAEARGTVDGRAGRAEEDRPPPAALGRGARAFRLMHTAIAVIELAALGHVWRCALQRRRDKRLGWSLAALVLEGAGLVVGRGNCPLGPLQRQLGDPVPLFELALPPRTAKAAVPVLTAVTLTGMALVVARPPGRPESAA